jgi:hypothetical protein
LFVIVWEPKRGFGGGHRTVLDRDKAERMCHRLNWGASSAAAKIYSNDALLGPIPVGFRVVQPLIAEYGVLKWCTSLYARHVFGPASTLHAVNRPPIPEVAMACNTPTHGYPDWSFTDLAAVSIWRTTR